MDGLIETQIVDDEGLRNSGFWLECGELDLRAAKAHCAPLGRGSRIDVIGASWKTAADVAAVFDAAMDDAVPALVAGVRDLTTRNLKYTKKKYSIILYPLLVSHYRYRGGTYQVQVDSYTRRVWVATGLRMYIRRALWAITAHAVRLTTIVLIGSYIAVGVGWCRGVGQDTSGRDYFRDYDTASSRGASSGRWPHGAWNGGFRRQPPRNWRRASEGEPGEGGP